MKSFLKRLFLFALIPFILLVIGYVYFDPFKVIYKYTDYSKTPVILDRDYVSTQVFLQNKDKYHFNSFIFGSSRTIAFKTRTWKKYLKKEDVPFCFDGAAESIYGIHGKLKYMDENKIKMDNVLIILCRDWMCTPEKTYNGHLFKKHPEVSGKTWVGFQYTFFKAYLNSKFLLAYYNYKFTGEFQEWMRFIINNDPVALDTISNEMNFPISDRKIGLDPTAHVVRHLPAMYDRKGEKFDSVDRIDEINLNMLREMKQILEKNKVNYKIVAGPLYDQVKFSKHDKEILVNFFGKNFYDYTGKNKYSIYKQNYYEISHYRPVVGEAIMKEIYQPEKQNQIIK
jgi:hypothetical protein